MCEYIPYDARAAYRLRVPANNEYASGKGYGEEGGKGVTNRRSESAGSANAYAFDRDARARSRKRTRAKWLGGGEESIGGMGVNMNARNTLVIRFVVVTMVLAISLEC